MVGHDHAIDADVEGAAGVLGVEHSLEYEAAAPVLAHPRDVIPGDAGVKLTADPVHEIGRLARARYGLLEIAERERSAAKSDIGHPAWMANEIEAAARPGPGRNVADHPGAAIAVPGPGDAHINRQQ